LPATPLHASIYRKKKRRIAVTTQRQKKIRNILYNSGGMSRLMRIQEEMLSGETEARTLPVRRDRARTRRQDIAAQQEKPGDQQEENT